MAPGSAGRGRQDTAAPAGRTGSISDAGAPRCVLPDCDNDAPRQGHPCAQCIDEFGGFLQKTATPPMTAAEQDQRDQAEGEACTRQRVPAGPQAARVDPARNAMEPGLPAVQPEAVRKANQRCWLCEERHTCTQAPRGWECDTCCQVV